MSTEKKEVKLSMRVMVNKTKTKVLFAVIDNCLADILLSFLSWPLGMIPRLLGKHYGDDKVPNIGSLNTLYKSLENMDSSHFVQEIFKSMLLNQGSSTMIKISEESVGSTSILKTVTFLISDDLRMLPNVKGSILQSIKDLGIVDSDEAEEMTVTIGFDEIMDLLKGSLLSQTPLTDLILKKNQMPNFPIPKFEPLEKHATCISSKKFMVKAMIQKSTNKFLFVEADGDFIDFLFSFLIIPLGQVEKLLGSNTCLGKIDNLYTRLANMNADLYFNTSRLKGLLLDPPVPHYYLSIGQIFPISVRKDSFTFTGIPKQASYVKGPGKFMVTNDLNITPLCMLTTLSTLKKMKIPLSDVKELEIDIGVEEGLSILKASLTSTSALTNGLIHKLRKQPKQEC